MTRTGKSIFYFGFWVLACGILLMFFPKFCLGFVGIVLPDYIVVRILGMVLLYLAVYYFVAGRHTEFMPFFRITIYTRSSALFIVLVFVIIGLAKPIIIAFVIVDLAGAIWTALALRMDRRHGVY
ncbi:hypothetical protein ACFL20_02535 [Spirochaetota bacterium]